MSGVKNIAKPAEIVSANRELFESLADSNLPIAKDVRNALEALDKEKMGK